MRRRAAEDDAAVADASGFHVTLLKPLNVDHLLRMIREQLDLATEAVRKLVEAKP